MGEKAKAGTLLGDELAHLRAELDNMAARGALPPQLRQLRADLLQLAATHAATSAAGPAAALPVAPPASPPAPGGTA
jgi:hypothetical protein